jgi:hypothetical protein
MTLGALPHPKFHLFELAVNDSFELAVREHTRAKYVIAILSNVDECDDNFFRWFKEISKRCLVNEVGPV